MIEGVLATCRACAHDVPVDDLVHAHANEYAVQLSWQHRTCLQVGSREVSRETALAVYKRNIGQKSRSTEEIILEEWAVDLGSRDDSVLTVKVFTDQWAVR